MPLFRMTLPAMPGKYFEVESKDCLTAVDKALNLSVWTEDEWAATGEYRKLNAMRRVDMFGMPY